ncbi:MAG: queuosine salvage family protein [Actinomycetota bacterium]|nr:queuosine salvage family protein [Actinomycetota bacterium]
MTDQISELRRACARVAQRARSVRIERDAIAEYAAGLPLRTQSPPPNPEAHLLSGTAEERAAFWLTLDAINFGSGWFPELRKRDGRSGYFTIAMGVRERFSTQGAWSAHELTQLTSAEIATSLRQSPGHELMSLFAGSLRDLGCHVAAEHGGRFASVLHAGAGSAPALAQVLGGWACFADTSTYDRFAVPFLKRAQIATADLARAGVVDLPDLNRLTIFADNLVPHVLRLDGVLRFDFELVGRIDAGELIEHGSPEEVEIRACALHAAELIVAQRPGSCAAEVDSLLWHRGQQPRYKASPRHRSRCTAY